ncbi:MAG: glucokinase [Deltaproteobacteria bacterium]|nr:glucokinase [Candidatus Zymogenaceae bacterium]
MIFTADIGGTTTRLALFTEELGGPVMDRRTDYTNRDFDSFGDIVADFLAGDEAINGACVAAAGPVHDGAVLVTNLSWRIDRRDISRMVGCDRTLLVNDLVALAAGTPHLEDTDLVCLHPGGYRGGRRRGTAAIVAAGTGLGEAYLIPMKRGDETVLIPRPSEGGHADYPPRNDEEAALCDYLRSRYGHVSKERVISGGGIRSIYEFLKDTGRAAPDPDVERLLDREKGGIDEKPPRERPTDPNQIITRNALDGVSDISVQTLRMFVSAYGAEAGNMALTLMADGGVYIGGGIAPKILPAMTDGRFIESFLDKGRLSDYLKEVPVWVIVNPAVQLIGAVYLAVEDDDGMEVMDERQG